MSGVFKAKISVIAEQIMDAAWPSWRRIDRATGTVIAAPEQMKAIVEDATAKGFALGERAGETNRAEAIEAEVQKRIRTVTEHHAKQLEEVKKAAASNDAATLAEVRSALALDRKQALAILAACGDHLERKHGPSSMLCLVVRDLERRLMQRNATTDATLARLKNDEPRSTFPPGSVLRYEVP